MTEWSVLLKCCLGSDEPDVSGAELQALLAALPYPDRTINGGPRDFTMSCYVVGPDPATATRMVADRLNAATRSLGLPRWSAIRAHTTSADRRRSGYQGVHKRVGQRDTWSVLCTLHAGTARASTNAEQRQLVEALPGEDKSVEGGRGQVIARFWLTADSLPAASRIGRNAVLGAMTAAGLDGWTIVRLHVATPEERAHDVKLETRESRAGG